jgi:hypothetical protein
VPDLRRHRARRLLRRLAVTVVVLIVLGILAFGGLLIVTPSVGNARQLVAAQDLAHHAAYPGPAVPVRFAESLVATEDKRFYSEPGIDLFAVGRVGFAYLAGRGIQGGATLYQQLAKLLYTQGRSSVSDEAEQVALAVKLYLTYTRQQILQMYADVVYFGNRDYGLAAASCGYFGVRPAGPPGCPGRRPRCWPTWCRAYRWTTRLPTRPTRENARCTWWAGWSPPGS